MDDTLAPQLFERPYLTSDVAGIGGRLKASPEDFQVEEIPLYEPSGQGQHLYVWVEKRDVAAPELIRRLASHFGVSRRDIGAAGMKDRHAITRQWISLPGHEIAFESPQQVVGEVDDKVKILAAELHQNKLRTGHARGNCFAITVRDLEGDLEDALARSRDTLERLHQAGIPNYYGSQRFGRELSTVALGLGLLRGDAQASRRIGKDRRLRRLAVNAVQSAIFNRVLAVRITRGLVRTAMTGDRLDRVGMRGQLLVEAGMEAEAQQGIDAGELVPTGPLPGPKMYPPRDDVRRLETEVYEEFGIDDDSFAPFVKIAPGMRRPLLVDFLDTPTVEIAPERGLRFGFSLPSGSYATVVLREIMKISTD